MCRALKVLCVAPTPEGLERLKRATVSAHWELVGGARSIDESVQQVDEFRPDVVVVDVEVGVDRETLRRIRAAGPSIRIVSVGGAVEGADRSSDHDAIREAILGVPPVGGPVRS